MLQAERAATVEKLELVTFVYTPNITHNEKIPIIPTLSSACEHETPTTAHTSQIQKSSTKENRIELYQLESARPKPKFRSKKKHVEGADVPKIGGERNLGGRAIISPIIRRARLICCGFYDRTIGSLK